MTKPVSKGDRLLAKVEDLSHEGQGIVKIDGYTVFTDHGLPGDLIEVEISKAKKNFGHGRMTKLVEGSKDRIESKCPYSKECGGCNFQEYSYEGQLKYKENKLRNNLERIGDLEDFDLEKIISMEEPFRYRNNVQLPLGQYRGKVLIGYFKKASNYIVDIDKCLIQNEIVDSLMGILREFMTEYNVRAYDPKKHKGVIRHLVVRTNQEGQAMVVIVTNGHKLPNKNVLVDMIKEEMDQVVSIIQNINEEKTNLTLGRKNHTLYGQDYLEDRIGDLTFEISPNSFFQINSIQTKKMYDKIKEYLDLGGEETVIDLYCGIGTIGSYIADRAKKVIGIELMKESIKDAQRNLKINEIENMEFREGYAENVFPKLVEEGIRADRLIVDPPRKGLDQEVIDAIRKLSPEKIVYVSCEPSTLARDLKELKDLYRIEKIQPVDMFPQTSHVETVVLLEKEII